MLALKRLGNTTLAMTPERECWIRELAQDRFEMAAATVDTPDEAHPMPGWVDPARRQSAWPHGE